MFVGAMVMFVAAAVLCVIDLASVLNGTIDLDWHMPFLLPAALVGFGMIIVTVLRHGVRAAEMTRPTQNLPHSTRRDAPDGCSD